MNTSHLPLETESPPSSAIDRAIAYGVDITLLTRNLRLTPTARVQQAQQALDSVTALQNEAKRWRARQGQFA